MIERFNDVEMRDSSVIYGSSLKQIKEMYQIDPNTAGELAISIIEVAITGQMSTNNPLIKMALANFEDVANKNKKKWDDKTAKQREIRIEKLQLRKIAKLLREGKTQKEIAKLIGKAPSSVSEAVRILKTEFSDILSEFGEDSENSTEYSEKNSEILNEDSENSVNSDFKFGEFEKNSDKFGFDDKIPELQRNSVNSENSPNSEYDNDNVNDNVNVNVTRVFPSEKTLETISLEELNRMGAKYELDGDVATFTTGRQMRVIDRTKKKADGTWDF